MVDTCDPGTRRTRGSGFCRNQTGSCGEDRLSCTSKCAAVWLRSTAPATPPTTPSVSPKAPTSSASSPLHLDGRAPRVSQRLTAAGIWLTISISPHKIVVLDKTSASGGIGWGFRRLVQCLRALGGYVPLNLIMPGGRQSFAPNQWWAARPHRRSPVTSSILQQCARRTHESQHEHLGCSGYLSPHFVRMWRLYTGANQGT